MKEMEDNARELLNKNGIVFDKYYWKQKEYILVKIIQNITQL